MFTVTKTLAGNRYGATLTGFGVIAGFLAILAVVVVTSIGASISSYIEAGHSPGDSRTST